MTNRSVHPLRFYLFKERLTYEAFAKKLKQHGAEVSPATVQKWVLSGHMPRKPALIAIDKATGGEVTATSFL